MNPKTNKIIVLVAVIFCLVGVIFLISEKRPSRVLEKGTISKEKKLGIYLDQVKECEKWLTVKQEFEGKEIIPDWVMCKLEGDKVIKIKHEDLFKGMDSIEPKPGSKIILSINLPQIFERGLTTIKDTHGNVEEGQKIEIPSSFILWFTLAPHFNKGEWYISPPDLVVCNSEDIPEIEKVDYNHYVCTKPLTKESISPISLVAQIPSKEKLIRRWTDQYGRVYYGMKIFISNEKFQKEYLDTRKQYCVDDLLIKDNGYFVDYSLFTPFYRYRIPIIFK